MVLSHDRRYLLDIRMDERMSDSSYEKETEVGNRQGTPKNAFKMHANSLTSVHSLVSRNTDSHVVEYLGWTKRIKRGRSKKSTEIQNLGQF